MIRLVPQLLIGALLFILVLPLRAQIPRYWDLNLNSEAALLSGAVVASKAGPTAIFYNPALISEARDEKFSFNANLFKFEAVEIDNAFGANLNFEENSVGLQPRFISFIIAPKKAPRWAFEVASLTRNERNIDFRTGINGRNDVIQANPGDDLYNASLEWILRYSDRWFGGGASYDIGKRFTLGASVFASLKKLRDNFTVSMSAQPAEDTIFIEGQPVPGFVSTAGYVQVWDIQNTRLLGKFGLQYRGDYLNVGLNFTTPSANLSGTADATREIGYSNIVDSDNLQFLPDVLIADSQNNLSAQLKDPWSIAFGLSYTTPSGKTFISFTTEYFAGIDEYRVIEGTFNPDITTPNNLEQLESPSDFLSVFEGREEVLNFGVGFEQLLTPKTSVLAGVRTDNDYIKDYQYSEGLENLQLLNSIHFDVLHLSGGAKFSLGKNRFIAGAQYSFGRNNNIPQIVDFERPDETDRPGTPQSPDDLPLQGDTDNSASIKSNALSLFFGFSFALSKKEEGQ